MNKTLDDGWASSKIIIKKNLSGSPQGNSVIKVTAH